MSVVNISCYKFVALADREALKADLTARCLGLNLKVVSLWAEGPFNHALEAMDEFQMSAAYRGYASAQLLTFEKYAGWFFWTYRTETTPAWCYRHCVEQGFIPDMGRPEQMAGIRAILERARNQAA